jgi:hypothetical protein
MMPLHDNVPTAEIMGHEERGWILDEAVLRSGDRIKQRGWECIHRVQVWPVEKGGGEKLCGLSLQANYTDRAAAACRRS